MSTFEDIRSANQTIQTTDIKGKDYAEVNQRVKAFRMVYPTGAIVPEIISLADGVVTMKATVLDEDGKVLGVGHAQEKESASYINKTSFIENCETSAVGRALGMCGFGIDTSICSAEELSNALANQGSKQEKKQEKKSDPKPTNTDDDPLELLQCADCGANLTRAVYEATKKQFGRPLCPECRKAG